ncbi:hypothetical protein AMELA_G00181910, partial [Ameiurus melas]
MFENIAGSFVEKWLQCWKILRTLCVQVKTQQFGEHVTHGHSSCMLRCVLANLPQCPGCCSLHVILCLLCQTDSQLWYALVESSVWRLGSGSSVQGVQWLQHPLQFVQALASVWRCHSVLKRRSSSGQSRAPGCREREEEQHLHRPLPEPMLHERKHQRKKGHYYFVSDSRL